MPTLTQLENMLKDTTSELNDRLRKMEEKQHHKTIGYAPQCKVCNHEEVDLIEKLHEEGKSLTEIKEELDLEMSIMSLSRHFKNHYPKRTRYKLTQKKLMLEEVLKTIEEYPYLETFFKNADYEDIDEFVNYNGFCYDDFRLCPRIEAKEVKGCTDVIWNLEEKLQIKNYKAKNTFYLDDVDQETIDLLNSKTQCLECRLYGLSYHVEILEKILAKLLLGIEDISEEDKRPHNLIGLLTLNYEEAEDPFYNDIFELAKENKKKNS